MGTSLVPIGDGGFLRADGGDFLCVAPDAATPMIDAAVDAASLPDAGPADACSAGATLCEGACVDTASDAAHCGSCGNACGTGETCVEGECFDPVVQVEAGSYHACARRASGSVWCWGANSAGELGDGTFDERLSPVRVIDLPPVIEIAAGGDFFRTRAGTTCARTESGELYCWGNNASGQVGDRTMTARSRPVLVSGVAPVRSVSVGTFHTCAVQAPGRPLCWGANQNLQLGVSTPDMSSSPLGPSTLANAVEIAAGVLTTCARTTGGDVWCWGGGMEGQLGDGSMLARRAAPAPTTPITDTAQLTMPLFGACALDRAGIVRCWGRGFGPSPVILEGVTATDIDGMGSVCAVVSDGVHCAGEIDAIESARTGEISITAGVIERYDVPNSVDVVEVASGLAFGCGRTRAARVVCWGLNTHGGLGNGTLEHSAEARAVLLPMR